MEQQIEQIKNIAWKKINGAMNVYATECRAVAKIKKKLGHLKTLVVKTEQTACGGHNHY